MAEGNHFVTIAMPCLNEEAFIGQCLQSVLEQTYPLDRIEVLVADGGSTDGTLEAIGRLAARDRRIRVIDNPERFQAAGLNRILREARGDVIVRMDVHCEYAPDYVQKCVEVLERTGADNVGGAQRCRGRSAFEKAVCAALRSPLGVGGAAYRNPEKEGYVDTVFLGAYRKSVFDRIGPWDPAAITNEDAELNQRLVAAGGRIYLSREIVVHYSPRSSFGALARQYYRYGRGRARTLTKARPLPVDSTGAALPGGCYRTRASWPRHPGRDFRSSSSASPPLPWQRKPFESDHAAASVAWPWSQRSCPRSWSHTPPASVPDCSAQRRQRNSELVERSAVPPKGTWPAVSHRVAALRPRARPARAARTGAATR